MQNAYAEACPPRLAQGELLARHAPLVARVVRQLSTQADGVMGRDDMEQIGLMALWEALCRYGEPDERFAGYAVLRVRGAILDELRRLDWRPRSVRQEAHRVRDGVRELRRRLGREPGEAEAAAALGLSAEEYAAAQMAEHAEALSSFDELVAAGYEAESAAGPEASVLRRLTLAAALQALDEREQRVVQLYYEFELSLKEIAAVLDLTEARVCQINKGALRKMKARLEAA